MFISFRIFEQLALALKTEFALKIFTVLNILFTFRIFEQLALALKNRVVLEFFNPGRRPTPPVLRQPMQPCDTGSGSATCY